LGHNLTEDAEGHQHLLVIVHKNTYQNIHTIIRVENKITSVPTVVLLTQLVKLWGRKL